MHVAKVGWKNFTDLGTAVTAHSAPSLPTTHYALHDNLPVGVYPSGAQRLQAAVYTQVEQVEDSHVEEVFASASSQRAASSTQQDSPVDGGAESGSMGALHSQVLLPGAVPLASQAIDICPTGEHIASSDGSVSTHQADGCIINECANQDLRWRNHGTSIADVTECSTPQVQCRPVSALRQSNSEERKSKFSV
eukprot:6472824-Amphidinium_carterae.1